MNIGILTFHDAHNYGAVLQAYALKKYLENQNHNARVINYHHSNIEDGFPQSRNKEKLGKTNLEMKFSEKAHLERWEKFDDFIKKLTNNEKKVYDSEEELEKIEDIDIFICGSDQIWNPDITQGLNKGFFLYFKTRAKKMAYAASMGIEKLKDEDEVDFEEYLNGLDFISVREQSLKLYSEKFTKKEVIQVLDPTFLLEKEQYNELLHEVEAKKYLLIYALGPDERLTKLAKYISKEQNLEVIELNDFEEKDYQFRQISNAGPSDFLSLIKNAEVVITNSFHGTIFSILFEREFYTLTRGNRNSRMESLLRTAGLQERLLHKNLSIDLKNKINFIKVKDNFTKKINQSKDFLKEVGK